MLFDSTLSPAENFFSSFDTDGDSFFTLTEWVDRDGEEGRTMYTCLIEAAQAMEPVDGGPTVNGR